MTETLNINVLVAAKEEYTKQLQEQAKQHELTVSDLTGQIEQLQADLATKETEFKRTIEELNREFKEEVAQMEQSNQEKNNEITQLRSNLAEAREIVATLEGINTELESALAEQQEQHTKYIDELTRDLKQQEEKMERLQSEKTGICQALKDLYTMGLTVTVQPKGEQDIETIRQNLERIDGSLNRQCNSHSTPAVEAV